MPGIVRLGDIGSGHACHFPATCAMTASPDVFVNGLPVVRVGDSYGAHGCVGCLAPDHSRNQLVGSPTVFINGRPAARIGDAISCGGVAMTGSLDVIIDGS